MISRSISLKRNPSNLSFIYVSTLLCCGLFSIIIDDFFFFHIAIICSAFYAVIRKDLYALKYFTLYTFFQNIVLIYFSPSLSSLDTQLFIAYKELVVYFLAILFFLSNGFGRFNNDILSKLVLLLLAFVFIFNLVRPNAPLSAKLLSLRQILIPFVCLLFGYSIVATREQIIKYFRVLIILVLILCLCGLLIYLYEPRSFWDNMNFRTYFLNKNGSVFEGAYSNFFSHDFGGPFPRFVSFMADPIATAHIIGLSFVYLFFVCKRKLIILKLLIFVCAILCFSKSLLFLLFTTILLLVYLNIEKKALQVLFVIGSIVSLFVLFALAQLYVGGLESDTASGNHLKSLIYAVNNNSAMGMGLGSAGYLAGITGGDIEIEYNESFLAMLIAQIGLVGTTVFYSYFLLKIKQMINIYRKSRDSYMLFAIIIFTDVVLESIVSGSSIAMLGTGLYFILPGLILRNHIRLNTGRV